MRGCGELVKGGVKLDHWGGRKIDQFLGSREFVLTDLRGRLERRPATRLAGRVWPERRPTLQIGVQIPSLISKSVVSRDVGACCL